ncbi:TlpA family protein disulfide reductase [Geodermatophilus sabuli]|uniref:Thiol-disulfide isomerase or thioredoxin n=1 Tax=Geodermatophilus sabuli TaxID=1564158 RepID=A0A285ECC4_9ACTN|nr:TlpA disulfide reductase family protein [Geodermatophilus sabuli]MBB3083511.1 thiol-disulfide isomerase/thioredoxin [Geodermatophilus sabuli]SNX96768.1 Thiol-disulfide isomerase or thioredoxin [Geodermatophilus sabuli]
MSARGRAAAGALLLLTLAGCGSDGTDDGAAPSSAPSVQNTTAACPDQPDAPASGGEVLADVTVDCLGGGWLAFGRAQGAPTVVNLWASWCGPCREELPLVQQLADEAGDRLRVLGLVSQDPASNGLAFAADAGVTMPTGVDEEGELAIEQGLRGLPYTYFLHADGSIAHLQLRPVTSLEELRGLVTEHLGVRL